MDLGWTPVHPMQETHHARFRPAQFHQQCRRRRHIGVFADPDSADESQSEIPDAAGKDVEMDLAQLGPEDGMSQTKLAEILSVGKAALGIFLDKLEANRLIVRRSDAVDRRLRRVYLTKDGAQIIKSMRVRLRSMSENILKGLSATDRDQLIHALDKVKANLLSLLEQH